MEQKRQEIKNIIESINSERFSDMKGRRIITVTKMNDFLTEPFDKEAQAKVCAEKGKRDRKYKYAGMSAEEILKLWEDKAAESLRYGSLLDEYAGHKFNGNEQETEIWKLDNNFEYDERLSNICKGVDEFINWMNSGGFVFVARELPVYVQSVGSEGRVNVVTGRFDALFYHPVHDMYAIVDWKTTEEIKDQAFKAKKMKGPAFMWEDCDMGKYTVQLHTYKDSLINTYRISDNPKKVGTFVVNLKRETMEPGQKNYQVYKENFQFDAAQLAKCVDFCIRKRDLQKALVTH